MELIIIYGFFVSKKKQNKTQTMQKLPIICLFCLGFVLFFFQCFIFGEETKILVLKTNNEKKKNNQRMLFSFTGL